MNPTRKHWQRFVCLLLAFLVILLLPSSGMAQESTAEPLPMVETTEEAPIATPIVETAPTEEPITEPIVSPTAEVTEAPVVTLEPEATAEPETTAEPEQTPEATAEVTLEPETTAEPEQTPEAEVTEAPESEVMVTEAGLDKVPAGFEAIVQLIQAGEIEQARLLLRTFAYRSDEQNRVALQIYPADGFSTQHVENLANRWNARVLRVNHIYIIAYIPMNRLGNLLENEMVGRISRPSTARSTGPVGTATTEAFNPLGLTEWHSAGFRGQGVRIGVIDTGFAIQGYGAFTDPDYSCLAEIPTLPLDDNHGLLVIQTVCDIAPDADVYPYTLEPGAADSLAAKIYEAIFDQIDVLIIAAEISDLAPGDGTGIENGSDDPYEALAAARAGGMVIFASAGNFGETFDPLNPDTVTRVQRYATFELTSTTPSLDLNPGSEVARINMRASVGDEIFVSWNDWGPNGLGLSDFANLEDFAIRLYMTDASGTTFIDANTTDAYPLTALPFGNVDSDDLDIHLRSSLFEEPSLADSVQPKLGSIVFGCPHNLVNNFDGTCHVALLIYRIKGDYGSPTNPLTFQVGLTPKIATTSSGIEAQNFDREITAVTGADINLITSTGTIARPADSPDVIAVGAVCGNETGNFPLIPDSSRGMIFGPNGTEPTSFPTILNQSNTKPEIVGLSFTSVTSNLATANSNACDGTVAGMSATGGFGGTSSAVSHVGAMTAVLLSNPAFRSQFSRDAAGVDALKTYIQQRSVELPLGTIAPLPEQVGFDYDYGAGLFILGSPDYVLSNTVNPTTAADVLLPADGNTSQCNYDDTDELGLADSNLYYVGQANLNSSQDGTLANPFLSIAQAIYEVSDYDCIVVMPGEYLTPILIDRNAMQLYGFDSVTSISFPSTVIRVSAQYYGGTNFTNSEGINVYPNGGIYLNIVDDTVIQGFTFIGARNWVELPAVPEPDLPPALPRQAIYVNNASDTIIRENNFGAVTLDGTTYDSFAYTPIVAHLGIRVQVEGNLFKGNIGGVFANGLMVSPVISVFDHGDNSAQAAVIRLNTIESNVATNIVNGVSYWPNLIYSSESYLDVVANTIIDNDASTLVYAKADASENIRVVSNVIQNNTLNTTNDAPTILAGALIQTNGSGNDLSFVNNTVVVNNLTNSGANGAILGRGTVGTPAAVGNFDFVNNVVFNNTFASNIQRVIASINSSTCNWLLAGSGAATRNNWWYSYAGTECGSAMTGNGNDLTTNPNTSPHQFMGALVGKNSQTDPLYYALGVTDLDIDSPEEYNFGVDASSLDNINDLNSVDSTEPRIDPEDLTAITTELGNNIDFTDYPFDLAANGQQRVFDIETWNNKDQSPAEPFNAAEDIDLGAFEFINLNIVKDDITISGYIEGAPLIAFDFSDDLQGGYGDLTFSVKIGPNNYSNRCNFSTTSADFGTFLGVQFGTGGQSRTLFYCPPTDFFTDPNNTLAAAYPDSVDITVVVVDELKLNDTTNLHISITPAVDADIADPDITWATDPAEEDFLVVANVEQQDVTVRLRPFVNFGSVAYDAGTDRYSVVGNFAFSERGNNAFIDPDSGNFAADYPFTYSAISVFEDDDNIIAGAGLGDVSFTGSDNIISAVFDMTTNEGTATIQYTVTEERFGGAETSQTFYLTVRAVSRIPRVAGLYDDSSFAFDYTAGVWSAVNDPAAVNNTLHITNANQAKTSFGFYGTGFTLYMKGQGPTLGGDFDLNLYINTDQVRTLGDVVAGANGGSAWKLVPGSTTVYQTEVWMDGGVNPDIVFVCTTDAIRAGQLQLSSIPIDYYAITCNGFYYTDSNANNQYDYNNPTEVASLTTMPSAIHLVEVVNLSIKRIAVDAFTLLDDNNSATADVPFEPGFHDVDELELRGAFGAGWVETRLASYSNSMAYVLTGSSTSPVSFTVTGGTGFAIGTTQEAVQTSYSVCVTNLSSNEITCQRYGYAEVKPATTPLLFGVYRPFYGLNPNTTYRVEILPETIPPTIKLVVDSLVVFEPSEEPLEQLAGSVDNGDFESLLYSGPVEDSWVFSTGVPLSFEGTMSSIIATLRAGNYVAFQTALDVDTVYWTFSATRPSTASVICVERGEGVDTVADTAYGNCIIVNLVTGAFWQVADTGNLVSGGTVQLTRNTIILRESDFRDDWEIADNDNGLTFEIFSIYDVGLAVDRMVAIGSGVPLTAGRYEEYTRNIEYYDASSPVALNPDNIAEIARTESTVAATYPSTPFVQVLGAGAARDFGQGVMFTKLQNARIRFTFEGTGFAPSFRMGTTTEEILVCWLAGDETVADTLLNGTCQHFDNENRTIVNNALRPILGLPFGEYTVAIQFLGDNFSPVTNRTLSPEMWFDGVVIYDEVLSASTLDALSLNTLYEANFSRRAEFNNFAYLGTGWTHDTTARARTYSGANVDTIIRGETGATVSFVTTGANAIVLKRNLAAANAPFLVCATELGVAYPIMPSRYCQTINNSGTGTGNSISIQLNNNLLAFPDYLVTITALNNGPVYFDAVMAVNNTTPLTAGQYDDNHPNLIYDNGSRNLVANGDMERVAPLDWSEVAGGSGLRVAGSIALYSGTAGLQVTGIADGSGVQSDVMTLRAYTTYSVIAHVKLGLTGDARMEVNGAGSPCVVEADENRRNVYQPLRCDITIGGLNPQVMVEILADGGAATFYVDDVRVTEGATWSSVFDRLAYGSFRQLSSTHGAEIRFAFTGTGFGLGLSADTMGGRMMVCYQDYSVPSPLGQLDFNIEDGLSTCISFENESSIARNDTMRIIDGLPYGTYAVVVRDMEDGDSVLRTPTGIRLSRLSVGQIRLDYLWVFNTVAPVITGADEGSHNESDANAAGQRWMQLIPASRWGFFSNAAYSNRSYASPIDANAVASRTTAGATALFAINGGAEARLVIDLKAAVLTNSNQILACVDDFDGIVRFNSTTKLFEIFDDDNNDQVHDAMHECTIITTATSSRYLVLTPTNLPLLGVAAAHTVTVQPLSAGTFTIDNYQVLFDSVLTEGYYEETIVADVSTVAGDWKPENNALYSSGSALSLTSTNLGANESGSMSFQFDGTGISIVSARTTTGGSIRIQIDGTEVGVTDSIHIDETYQTDFAALAYGQSYSFTALPDGAYNVVITVNTDIDNVNATIEKVVIDAVEIYGTLQTLGSLYDDMEVDTAGVPFLTFGPDNASWVVKTGAAAPTALNRTLHSTNRAGATFSFQMENAVGLILYYGAGTVTTGVEVCFREVGNEINMDCPPVVLTTTAGNVQIDAPTTGNWLVSITNTEPNKTFAVDAVQVLEAGLHEGIFTAADIAGDSTTVFAGGAGCDVPLDCPASTAILIPLNGSLEFDITGVAFSLMLENVGANPDFEVCVDGTCENHPLAGETIPATGLVAISYAGLHDGSGNEVPVNVTITNNSANALRIKSLHILGDDDSLFIADTSRYENTDTTLRYLPFGSMVNTVVAGNRQSGGSEHSGLQFGEMVYFEIDEATASSIESGIGYARQVSPAMTGSVEICYGQFGTSSAEARTATQCTTVSNTNPTVAYQTVANLSTLGNCENGCWVTIRNQQAKAMAIDFVRRYDAGAPLNAGYYQHNYPGLNYAQIGLGTGGTWSVNPVAAGLASDGFVRQAIATNSIDNNNGPYLWFVMSGTGFSIDFVNDTFSDAVRICYAANNIAEVDVQAQVLEGGTCQIYDNEARAVKGDAQRNVLGLPFGTYTVAVQMLRDNLSPARHLVTASPIKMNIDAVEIHSGDDADGIWMGLTPLTAGRYETRFISRVADNRFFYVGESWLTLEGSRARTASSSNIDQVREYGGAIAFHVKNANAMTLYTSLGRSNTSFRICATPVDATINDIAGETICQDFSTLGIGMQQPLSFRFHDYAELSPSLDYLVSISSMDDLIGFIDAIEITNTVVLSEGFYEGTNVNLFTDSSYTDYIYNGRMEVNGFWETINDSLSNQSAVRYEGAFGWHVVTVGVGEGIGSQRFALEDGYIYTVIARVKVTSGSVRIRLVQDNSEASIEEFRAISPTGGPNNGDWLTLRADLFLPDDPLTSSDNVSLQIVSNSQGSVFDVDDVHLYRGGLWTGTYIRSYSFGSAWQSQSPGAAMYFDFTGTGFELGTELGATSGEMEICYDLSTELADGYASCFAYQNESNRTALGVARTITGLPNNTYSVRIRDLEDGRSSFRPRLNASRINRNAIGKMTIDYIRIFGLNTITTTPASFFNENAEDSSGNRYLQVYPSQDWASITARPNTGFSGDSYLAVVDSRRLLSRTDAGQTAMLYVDVPDEGATVILYTGPVNRTTSTQFLVCAADTGSPTLDATNGAIRQSETKVATLFVLKFFLESPSTPSDCVLLDGTLGTALAVGPNQLAALGSANTGPVRVTFTSLTTGQFLIDGFQVIEGNTLTAGIYDSFLPDNLLNFNSSNSNEANRAPTGCNPDFNWCTVKVARSFGDTILSTQDNNASLHFDIEGTGFSVITNLGAGARMRICYTQTPSQIAASFPSKEATGGNGSTPFTWNNEEQDLTLGGVWCELVTTNNIATFWNSVTPDRRLPVTLPQYGFAFYGLPFGNYSVEVRMMDIVPLASANSLKIDAIAVFGNYNDLPVMTAGFYDNTETDISFEPLTQWNNVISRLGPPRGPYNLTETTSTNAGAIMQMRVDGNAMTLFQTFSVRNTADARICVVVTGAVIHCSTASATTAMEVENPTSTASYALAFELANFSQAGRSSYFAPIMFYGLGAGEHSIIIENRDHNKILSFDAILIQE